MIPITIMSGNAYAGNASIFFTCNSGSVGSHNCKTHGRIVITITVARALPLVLLNPDMPYFCKQCRFRSV